MEAMWQMGPAPVGRKNYRDHAEEANSRRAEIFALPILGQTRLLDSSS
jgi:hypothetical protein